MTITEQAAPNLPLTGDSESAGGTSQNWVLALTSAAALMVALDQLVVATALNSIRDDLHASIGTLEWTVNAFSLSFAVLLILASAVGDRFGRRRMLAVGLGVFTAASAACAIAPGTGALIAARAVQGLGAALVMPLAVAILTAAFPPERRGAALGVYAAVVGLAVVGGPLVGGAITEGVAWQWIFWVNVPIGLALIPLVLRRTSESRGPRRRSDLPGVALVSVGMLGLVWGLIRGTSAGWGSAEVVGMLGAGVAATGAFILWERRADAPMLPVRLFRDRTFSAGNASAFLLSAALFSTVFFFAQYLQVSLGDSPFQAGLRFLPWTVTLFVIAPVAGKVSDRIGNRTVLALGLGLQAIGLGWLAASIAGGQTYAGCVAALVVAGCGTSMALPSGQNAVMSAVAPAEVGQASGVFNTARQIGGAFGVAILAAVFAAHGSYSGPQAFRDGVSPALFAAAGLSALGALASAFVTKRALPRVRPIEGGASRAEESLAQ